jgi:protein arginine kinase activator
MLCDICKKKEAVIHIQEISANGKKVINLCNECAEKHPQADKLFNFGELILSDVIENIKKISEEFVQQKKTAENSPVCPVCGWNMKKMNDNNGLFGCSKCYEVFADMIGDAVNNIHRSRIHTGKRPQNIKYELPEIRREKLRKLEQELQDAINSEAYEQATVLRDQIAAFKKSRKNKSGAGK